MTTSVRSSRPVTTAGGVRRMSAWRAFLGLCQRDLWATVRHEPLAFLSQALLQPIFFLFVFGRVLPEIGAAGDAYGVQLLPGIIALTVVLTAVQNTALPLVIGFSFTKELEDRLLAPLPVEAVAVQTMLMAAARGVIGGLLILPLGQLILPGGVNLGETVWLGFVLILVLGAITGAGMGMVLGTSVPPNRISVAFAVVLTPLIFTGSTFYPWAALGRLRWFQTLTLANPLTYVSEGMRAALTPIDHLSTVAIALGILASLAVFGGLGVRGFARRATS